MSFFEAILLGLIQGITEFFPISSSGHLIIMEQLLGVESEFGVFLNVFLHIGTLMAVLLAFRRDVKRLFYSLFGILHDVIENLRILYLRIVKKQDMRYKKLLRTSNRRLLLYIVLANIPTLLIGYILHGFVSSQAITLFIVGFALLVTGLLLFIAELAVRSLESHTPITWKSALMAGVCQGFAVIPGISRFGFTLSIGLFCGFSRNMAIKYSFLISIPAVICAAIYELFQLPSQIDGITFGFAVSSFFGAAAAFMAGSFAVRIVLWVVKNSKLRYFSCYCFIVGILSIILNYTM